MENEQDRFEIMEKLLKEDDERYRITNGVEAEWAVQKINSRNVERDKILADIDKMIEHYKQLREKEIDKAQRDNSFLMSCLRNYLMDSKDKKVMKTMEYIRVPSAKLVLKYGGYDYDRNDEAVCDYLRRSGKAEFIETKQSVKWSMLKKHTVPLSDGSVCDAETSEIIPGIIARKSEDKFEIKEV